MLTNFQNGSTSFGIPMVGAGVSLPKTFSGNIWFVDNTLNVTANFGQQSPLPTISSALNLAQAGDTIYVFAGSYAENVVVTKNYITILGSQLAGYARPDVTPASGLPIDVQAQGFRAINMRFAGTASDSARQSGNGFEFTNCVFDGDLTAAKAGLRLVGAQVGTDTTHYTASEGVVQGCLFRGSAVGIIFDTAPAVVGVGSTDNLIQDNIFDRNTLDLATADSGPGTYSVQFAKVLRNQFIDKNKSVYLDFTTANGGAASDQSGAVNGNYFASDTMTTTKIKAVGTGFTFSGNYITTGIFDGSGLD